MFVTFRKNVAKATESVCNHKNDLISFNAYVIYTQWALKGSEFSWTVAQKLKVFKAFLMLRE